MKVEVTKFSSLAAARVEASRLVDAAAEAARTKYITPGSGQAMEYEAAVAEARRFTSGDSGAFLMLQADVDAGLSSDITGAAALVLYMRGQWEIIGSVIRRVRLEAKRHINAATTQAQVAQLREAALQQLASL